jgi:cation:H+ antiporter
MSLPVAALIFFACAAAIGFVGTKMTGLADRLADRTGLGEAFVGAVFLGAATSLPGITVSVTAALDGHAQLALSNAIGGIAAQTAFLAVADIFYRKSNLEHAAASVPNMMQAAVLIILLSLLIAAMAAPAVDLWGIHPVTVLLPLVYVFGMGMVRAARRDPMWHPEQTHETDRDTPDEPVTDASSDLAMWLKFAGAAGVVVVAGYFITGASIVLADGLGLNHTIAGALFTAVATSLPELVTSIAAVRRGALTLAVGGVIGGNCFDTLFAAVADVAYRDGSLYHAALASSSREVVLLAVSILMTGILLLGLLRRQKQGPGRIGFESLAVLVIYGGTLVLLAFT